MELYLTATECHWHSAITVLPDTHTPHVNPSQSVHGNLLITSPMPAALNSTLSELLASQ